MVRPNDIGLRVADHLTMAKDEDQLPQEGGHLEVEGGPLGEEVIPAPTPYQLRVSRRTREYMVLILLVGILAIACGLWMGRAENGVVTSRPAASPGVQAGEGDLESTPEVKYATTGEWVETSGLWSGFGVLGAAFDGERIVLSSGESRRGSLGCWISPRERPMTGTCYETGRDASSKSPAGRTCSWQIVVLEISPGTIRGAQALKAGESDSECAVDYISRPAPFKFERPLGRQNPEGRKASKPS